MPNQTVVKYGDVLFHHCLTKRFDQTPVFDRSGTDLVCWKFTVRIVGYILGKLPEVNGVEKDSIRIGPQARSGTSAAKTHKNVRYQLTPRQEFLMSVGANDIPPGASLQIIGGERLLHVFPYTHDSVGLSKQDVNNGPKCTDFQIVRIAGDDIFKCEAEFEIHKVECDFNGDARGNLSGVLNNRWSVFDSIDENGRTTRTWHGQVRLANPLTNANNFRDLALPVQAHRMKRKSMNFRVTEDGLNLEYEIVDQEVYDAPPKGAISWEFDHTVTVGDEISIYEDLTVRLDAERNVDLRNMTAMAAAFIEMRVLRPHLGARVVVVESLSFTQLGGEHRHAIIGKIRVHAPNRAALSVGQTTAIESVIGLQPTEEEAFKPPGGVSRSPGYDPNVPPGSGDPTPRTHAAINLVNAAAAAFQTPCDGRHNINAHNVSRFQLGTGSRPAGRGGAFGSGSDSNSVPSDDVASRVDLVVSASDFAGPPPWVNSSHLQNMYVFWQMHSRYEVDEFKAHLPVAGFSDDQNITATSAVIRLALPTMTRVTRLQGERVGEWPQMPAAPKQFTDENGVVYTLLKSKVQPVKGRETNGEQVFVVDAEFWWALSRPLTEQERWPVGLNPWETDGVNLTTPVLFSGPVA